MEKPYSRLKENLARVRHEIAEAAVKYNRDPADVRLMAVTKTVPAHAVNELIALGADLIGENKAQELLTKYLEYDKRARIDFIGHLQSNKAASIIDKVSMIHSVDRISLAEEISAQAAKRALTMEVLVEVNIGGEDSKSGVGPGRLAELLHEIAGLPNLTVKGLMTIPPFSGELLETERYFYRMRQLLVDMRGENIDNIHMDILSMGMSGDYVLAIKHGSNIVRVGSAIFGARD